MKPEIARSIFIVIITVLILGASDGGAETPTPMVAVTSSNMSGFSGTVESVEPDLKPANTADGLFLHVDWADTPLAGEIGRPALPVVRRLFVAPPGASVEVRFEEGPSTTIKLGTDERPWRVMPMQPPIPKLPGAREDAQFQYDPDAYTGSPARGPRVVVSELGLVRGERLYQLEARPLHYDPAKKILTLWQSLSMSVHFGSGDDGAHRRPIASGLDMVILNPEVLAGTEARGTGEYLIVVDAAFQATIAPFATAKTNQGFTVTTHVVDGATNSQIKSWVQTQWDGGTTFDYVLLVGDTDSVPHWIGSGNGSPDTDLYYGCMDGAGDYLADIAVGRFPARTTEQLQAIIEKTLYYENGPLADPDYLKRAVYMAGNDNYSITEGTHEYCITNHMDPNGYTSDRIFEVSTGGTTQDVRNSFNDGRGYGIYSGHGGETSWADGPPFSQSDVNNLTNANMYSMVWSFACVTGSYTMNECFTETWIRAASKGAVTIYGSSVNSYWTEDDILQRRLFDVIFDNADDVSTEVGPVWNETNLRFVAHFGTPAPGNDELRYLEMYNLMGDPSLRLPGKCSDAGTVAMDRSVYACEGTVAIGVSDCGLNLDDNTIETVTVTIDSTTEPGGEQVTLTETDAASADFRGSISVSASDAAGVLQVAEHDTITATYVDTDDGQGGSHTPVTATATVDCTAPNISNVRTTTVEGRRAVVEFDADESVIGHVHYGTACDALLDTASSSGLATAVQVEMNALNHTTTYFYAVEAEDAAGHVVSDNNGGACYSFTTLVLPDFFTELFDGSGNDLEGLSLTYSPDGSGSYYRACTSAITDLPVDPSGGTTISLADDDSEQVSPVAGVVSFYGTDYPSFWVGSNGYLTFDESDTGFSESLEEHFSQVRISLVFDDLNPSTGGTVSWLELGDRVVVTWDGVPEYSSGISNTFQVEMHHDGTLVLSYLEVGVSDGLAGLSEGIGLDPDFEENDLSAFMDCGGMFFGDGFEDGTCDKWDLMVD